MDFDAAKRALEACDARETTMDMMYTPEFTTYELTDGRILCVTLDGPVRASGARTIVRMEECRDADKPKGERTYDRILSTRLK
jgi:hypothetical protein